MNHARGSFEVRITPQKPDNKEAESANLGRMSIDKKFSEFWDMTPFAGTVDKKPKVQSLRHTFVVDKMNEWMENGIDTAVMMPYLSRYLGHSSISETQYYFHTIEQIFPVIRRHDAAIQRLVPQVVADEE